MKSSKVSTELSEWLKETEVVVVGRHPEPAPERSKRVSSCTPGNTACIAIHCVDIKDLRFDIRSQLGYKNQLPSMELKVALQEQLKQLHSALVSNTRAAQKLNVVVDMTDADWEMGFFVLPALRDMPWLQVTCAFTAPDGYPQSKEQAAHPPINGHSIRQPPGFIADFSAEPETSKHVFFLGFDSDRSQKFIEHYDWVRADCIAVIGDPPYISRGVQESHEANKRLLHKEIPNTSANRRVVAAANPKDTQNLLRSLLNETEMLDVMLLGTSPMTLGAIAFYLELTEEEKSRVRFLHDFPVRQTGRTVGVGQTWLYPFLG